MSRNNVKLLTEQQYDALIEKYIFSIDENDIVVRTSSYNRETRHPIDQAFHINAKHIRKICFNLEAINIWRSLLSKGFPANLIAVQQAVNMLTITYQKINEDNVRKILSGQNVKIKRI